jgi:Domain of unknown function DUF1828
MFNCDWAKSLTSYECNQVKGLDGAACLEIGTPFSMPDGAAVNLYIVPAANGWLKISDNADTVFQLSAMGLDAWNPSKQSAMRRIVGRHGLTMGEDCNISLLSKSTEAAFHFAKAVTALIAVSEWAATQLEAKPVQSNIFAELEPYIIARNPAAEHHRNVRIMGASSVEHTFQLQHGTDLIDVISAHPNATGAAMRKAGDVQNGAFAEGLQPLIIVDDRKEAEIAMHEIGILGSITRAMPASRLMQDAAKLH